MELKVRGSACRWCRVSAVGLSQRADDRSSAQRTVGDRAVWYFEGEQMLCEIVTGTGSCDWYRQL
jgi:hypothetical protein